MKIDSITRIIFFTKKLDSSFPKNVMYVAYSVEYC